MFNGMMKQARSRRCQQSATLLSLMIPAPCISNRAKLMQGLCCEQETFKARLSLN